MTHSTSDAMTDQPRPVTPPEARSTPEQEQRLEACVVEVIRELRRAMTLFGPFKNGHEGWAVIREEVDELWDAIKTNKAADHVARQRKEAIQVAAMALRFVVELGDRGVHHPTKQVNPYKPAITELVDNLRAQVQEWRETVELYIAKNDLDPAMVEHPRGLMRALWGCILDMNERLKALTEARDKAWGELGFMKNDLSVARSRAAATEASLATLAAVVREVEQEMHRYSGGPLALDHRLGLEWADMLRAALPKEEQP